MIANELAHVTEEHALTYVFMHVLMYLQNIMCVERGPSQW
jgi:hypothetical protein